MKKIILIILVMMSWGCNNPQVNEKKVEQKPAPKVEHKKMESTKVIGKILPEYNIASIVINKKDSILKKTGDERIEAYDTYTIHISVPMIISNNEDYFEFINKEIRNHFLQYSSIDSIRNHPRFHDFTVERSFKIYFSNKKILSFLIKDWNREALDSIPCASRTVNYTYDLRNKKLILNKDLIKKDSQEEFYKFIFKEYFDKFGNDVLCHIQGNEAFYYVAGMTKIKYYPLFVSDVTNKSFTINNSNYLLNINQFNCRWEINLCPCIETLQLKIPLDKIRQWCNEDVLKLME